MKLKKCFLKILLPVSLIIMSGQSAARLVNLKGTSWEKHAKAECGLDPYLLYAVSLRESATAKGKKGYTAPNPLALNNPVYGSYYPSDINDAKKALKKYLNASLVTDIGIGQINYKWNGHYVKNPEDLLDTDTNIRISAKILCKAIRNKPDDIAMAIGNYHTQNPKLKDKARSYGNSVLLIWKRLIENG